jgi:ubiquinone/menaquinone biosynthesis C-methylase UbiE
MSAEHRFRSSLSFNPEVDVPAAVYVSQVWWYSLAVLYPAQALKRMALFPKTSVGRYPTISRFEGEGRFYCREYTQPVFLDGASEYAESVTEFGRRADLYEAVILPCTRPVHEEAFTLIRRLLPPATRIMDLSCGPGTQSFSLAELVPEGEVVGIDLAAEMVATAHTGARQRGLLNTAFFQADASSLPSHFAGRFDAVHCSFAFHHYQNPAAVLSEMHRVLNRHGKAFVIDGGATWWSNLLGAPYAKWGDPGWVAFHTGEEFEPLFLNAGFSSFYWEEVLPGVGICVGSK